MGFWIWVVLMAVAGLAVPIAAFIEKRNQPKPVIDDSQPLLEEAPNEEVMMEEEGVMMEPAAEENPFDFGGDAGEMAGFSDDDFK